MKKKQGFKKLTIVDNVFKAVIHLFVGCSHEKFRAKIDRLFNTELQEERGAGGQFVSVEQNEVTQYCLWVETFDWKILEQGWLNHELVHCACTILKDRGITVCDETEEVLAYYHTFLKEETYKRLVK